MATLSDKAATLSQQLGFEPGLAIVEVLSRAVEQLGLSAEAKGLHLVDQADLCMRTLGVGVSSTAVVTAEVVPMAVAIAEIAPIPVQPAVAKIAPIPAQPAAALSGLTVHAA
eukprot:2070996-Prymnesium_polylepis.1